MIIERANRTDIQQVDSPKNKIRRLTLEIISIVNYPSEKTSLPIAPIIDL